MTQDEIIEMAEQSNLLGVIDSFHYDTKNWVEEAIAFAKLVENKTRQELRDEIVYKWVPPSFVDFAVKDEREVCAKICIDLAADYISKGHPASEIAAKALAVGATQIRARGEA